MRGDDGRRSAIRAEYTRTDEGTPSYPIEHHAIRAAIRLTALPFLIIKLIIETHCGTLGRNVIPTVCDIVKDQPWQLHYVYAGTTHVHVLLSWRTFVDWNDVRVTIKRKLGKRLSDTADRPGPWFVRGGKDSSKRVTDRKHFNHLMTEYLSKPAHRGWHWRDGCDAPWRVE
jgi:hypothetical protein